MARPTEHDPSQIAIAAQRLPTAEVADRMGCSARTVQRVVKQYDIQTANALRRDQVGTVEEWRRWRFEAAMHSVSEVARRYVRSRQAIYNGLNRLDTLRDVGGHHTQTPNHQTS